VREKGAKVGLSFRTTS